MAAIPADRTQPHAVKRRVVHVTTVPMSLVFLRGQVGYMRSRGYDVVAISSPGEELERFGAEQDIDVVGIGMPRTITPLQDLRALWQLYGVLRSLAPDVVHAHTPKGGLLGTLAAALAGVPVRIYHMRGLPMMTATGMRKRLLRLTERVTCAVADRVISVSKSLRDVAVAERLCPTEKITTIGAGSGNGVDAERRFAPTSVSGDVRASARARYGIPGHATVIGFVGRLVRDKGIVELITAFRELAGTYPDLHLLVVGMREERDDIPADVARALAEEPRIHWQGPDWNTPPLYAAMDIVALPSYREGFPNVPLEAAAMERPVVATDIPGCCDAVEPGVTGLLVPVRDASALATALRAYIDNPAMRDAHGKAGRIRVLRQFRPEAIWSEIEQAYSAAIASATSRQRGVALVAKRTIDVSLSALALAVSAPVLAGAAAAVAATMGRPVMFTQVRPGKAGTPIRLYKLRTMTNDRGTDGDLLPDAERLTPLGRLLRATSLDDLPNLLNVLKGELSLVGPRPLLTRYMALYSPEQARRHEVLPGITGWAQIHGRNSVSHEDKFALDVWYVDHWSLWLDLTILAKTILTVVRRDGITGAGEATMDVWTGNGEPHE